MARYATPVLFGTKMALCGADLQPVQCRSSEFISEITAEGVRFVCSRRGPELDAIVTIQTSGCQITVRAVASEACSWTFERCVATPACVSAAVGARGELTAGQRQPQRCDKRRSAAALDLQTVARLFVHPSRSGNRRAAADCRCS